MCQISSQLYLPRHRFFGSNMSTMGLAIGKLRQTLHWTQGMKSRLHLSMLLRVTCFPAVATQDFSRAFHWLHVSACSSFSLMSLLALDMMGHLWYNSLGMPINTTGLIRYLNQPSTPKRGNLSIFKISLIKYPSLLFIGFSLRFGNFT